MIAAEDLTFGFVGGTMAGQNIAQCSGCYALLLSGSIDGHRAWHKEVDGWTQPLPELFGGGMDEVPDMAGEDADSAVRREGADQPGEPGLVADGPDNGIMDEGPGTTEVVDPQNPERADGEPVRRAGKARGPVKKAVGNGNN